MCDHNDNDEDDFVDDLLNAYDDDDQYYVDVPYGINDDDDDDRCHNTSGYFKT